MDIDPNEGDKLDDPSGCHDAVRASIPPEKIKALIVSKELKDSAEIGNIVSHQIKPVIFVQDTSQDVFYTYRTATDLKTIKLRLSVPDYERALTEVFLQQFAPTDKPMFIHTARI